MQPGDRVVDGVRCSEARVYYGLLLDKYASSSLKAQATKNDKDLLTATTKKDKTKCTS